MVWCGVVCCVVLCGVVWCVCGVCVVWCVCGVVCSAAWHAEKTSVCRFKTSPCVPAPRAHVCATSLYLHFFIIIFMLS